ncbi:unnamed protein product, partial [marine sediment metagenome]
GPKGSGKFERISWDEALDTVAAKIREVIDKYGNQSLLVVANGIDFLYFLLALIVNIGIMYIFIGIILGYLFGYYFRGKEGKEGNKRVSSRF